MYLGLGVKGILGNSCKPFGRLGLGGVMEIPYMLRSPMHFRLVVTPCDECSDMVESQYSYQISLGICPDSVFFPFMVKCRCVPSRGSYMLVRGAAPTWCPRICYVLVSSNENN